MGVPIVMISLSLINWLVSFWERRARAKEQSLGIVSEQLPKNHTVGIIMGSIVFVLSSIFALFMFVPFLINWFKNPDIEAAPLVLILIGLLVMKPFILIKLFQKSSY